MILIEAIVVAVCFLQAKSTTTAFQLGLGNNAFVRFRPVRWDKSNENHAASQWRESPPLTTMTTPLVNPVKRRLTFQNSKSALLSSPSDNKGASSDTTPPLNSTLSSELSSSMVRLLARFVTTELKSLIQDGEHKERVKDLNEQLEQLEATVRETQEAQEKLAPTWKAADEAVQQNRISNEEEDNNSNNDYDDEEKESPPATSIRTPASPVAATAGKHFTGDVSTNRTVTLFDRFDTEESANKEKTASTELSDTATTDSSIPSNGVEALVEEMSDEIFNGKDEVISSMGKAAIGNEGQRVVTPRIPSVISMDFGKPLPVITETEGSTPTSTSGRRPNTAIDGMGSNVVSPPSMSLSSSSLTMNSEVVDMSEPAVHTSRVDASETSANGKSQKGSDIATPAANQVVEKANNKESGTELSKPTKNQVAEEARNNGRERQQTTKDSKLFFVDVSEPTVHTKLDDMQKTSANVTSKLESDVAIPVVDEVAKEAHNKDSSTKTKKPIDDKTAKETHNSVKASGSTERQPIATRSESVDKSEPAVRTNVIDAQESSANVTFQQRSDISPPAADQVVGKAHNKDGGSETAMPAAQHGVEKPNTDSDSVKASESRESQPIKKNLEGVDKSEQTVHTNIDDAQEPSANATSQRGSDIATPVVVEAHTKDSGTATKKPIEGNAAKEMHNTDSGSAGVSESTERKPIATKLEGVDKSEPAKHTSNDDAQETSVNITSPLKSDVATLDQVVEKPHDKNSGSETTKSLEDKAVKETHNAESGSGSGGVEASEPRGPQPMAMNLDGVDADVATPSVDQAVEEAHNQGSETEAAKPTDDKVVDESHSTDDSGSVEASESTEQQPTKKLTDEELAARYAAIPNWGERAFAILLDLGMIQINPDPDDPNYDNSHDDEFCV